MKNLTVLFLLFTLTAALFPSIGRGEEGNTFVPTGNLNTARYGHTATLLNSGKVLVTGGINKSILNSTELYDPSTGAWSPTGFMMDQRTYHIATKLPDGRILVTGGTKGNGIVVSSAELYNPLTGTWTPTGSMLMPRVGHSAILLQSGKVLITGGVPATYQVTSSSEIFDPATNQFTPAGNLNVARRFHAATLLSDGRVLISGGGTNSSMFASSEIYDPTLNTWSITGPLNKGNEAHRNSTVLLANEKVLVAGGGGDAYTLSISELYESESSSYRYTGSLTYERKFAAAVRLKNDKVLITGGRRASGGLADKTEIYDPATEIWEIAGALNTPRYEHTATLLLSGDVLVAGGFDLLNALASSEIFKSGGGAPEKDVAIDLTPGENPNTIKLGSQGTIAVAILGTPDFDAGSVDSLTAVFAGAPIQLKRNGSPMASLEDINSDGFIDLIMHFARELLELTPDDTEAVLEAKSIDGKLRIFGRAPVRILP